MSQTGFGLHFIGGPRPTFGEFVAHLKRNQKTLPLAYIVDEFGLAAELEDVASLIVGRKNSRNGVDFGAWNPHGWEQLYRDTCKPAGNWAWNGTPEHAAEIYYALMLPIWLKNPAIKVWGLLNEVNWFYPEQEGFYIRVFELEADRAIRAGVTPLGFTPYGSSVGTPQYPHLDEKEGNPITYASIRRVCDVAREMGRLYRMPVYLSLHEYALQPELSEDGATTLRASYQTDYGKHLIGRYTALEVYLRQRGAEIPIIITEAGQGGGYRFIGSDGFVNDFAWLDQLYGSLSGEGKIKFAAWLVGKWSAANASVALWNDQGLPSVAEYLSMFDATPGNGQLPPARVPYPYSRHIVLFNDKQIDEPTAAKILVEHYAGRKVTSAWSANDAFIPHEDIVSLTVDAWNWPDEAALLDFANRHYPPVPASAINFKTWDEDTTDPVDPPPAGQTIFGLHLPAFTLDPNVEPVFSETLAVLKTSKVDAVKLLSDYPPQTLDRLIAEGYPPDLMTVRLMSAGNDPIWQDSERFYNTHRNSIAHADSRGIRLFEIGNEPNIPQEGLGVHWSNAIEFADFYSDVAQRLHADFPHAQRMLPGLSPQDNMPEWRGVYQALVERRLAEALGIHSYWVNYDPHDEGSAAYWQYFAEFTIPKYLTEFANLNPSTHRAQIGREYVDYVSTLAGIEVAYAYISHTTDADHQTLAWRRSTDGNNQIAEVVGQRPPITNTRWLGWPSAFTPAVITSTWDEPRNYANGLHEGIDGRAPFGTAIVSPVDGKVIRTRAGVEGKGYGRYIVIETTAPNGRIYWVYLAHLSRWIVQEGQEVKRGFKVAEAGDSGNASGAHIHLTLKDLLLTNDYAVSGAVDPRPFGLGWPR